MICITVPLLGTMNTTNFVFLIISFQGSFQLLSKWFRSHQSISSLLKSFVHAVDSFINEKNNYNQRMCFFSLSVNWKKGASLDSFRQKRCPAATLVVKKKKN